jgi:lysozyme family protein
MRYGSVWPVYKDDWDRMTVTGNPAFPKAKAEALFTEYAHYAVLHRDRYVEIERASGVPWEMVAVIHRREADGDFDTYLGNGQSLHRRTTEVPVGRGPFASFLNGAMDALHYDALDSVKDWRLEKILYWCTTFNGWGYGANSPYIWGLTNIQRPGKYIRDHVFSSTTWDTQPGCAPLLWMISKIDPTIVFTRET